MPSSITLTVSHLPSSTSFFLSALQPLDYVYRGRIHNTIGFGPSNTPPDFWISQETPGVPAGAAHVAFPASSKQKVQNFFIAALKAGGKCHGEPLLRDPSTGYYSAAVIDLDGNSIEAVYRDDLRLDSNEESRPSSMSSVDSNVSRTKSSRASKAPTQVSKASTSTSKPPSQASKGTSQISRASSQSQSNTPDSYTITQTLSQTTPKGELVTSIVSEAKGAISVAKELLNHVRPALDTAASAPDIRSTSRFPLAPSTTATASNTNSHGPSDTIVGTLLGVAAGAALHYAYTKATEGTKEKDAELERLRAQAAASSQHRPMPTRAMTESVPSRASDREFYYHNHLITSSQQPYAIEAPASQASRADTRRMITMHDNDEHLSTYTSTTQARPRRRSSFSGTDVRTITSMSRASQNPTSNDRALEAPPSSYRNPTVMTAISTGTNSRSRSKSRVSESASVARSSSVTSRRSSQSHASSHRTSKRSSSEKSDASTVKPAKVPSQAGSKPPSRAPSRTSSYTDAAAYPLPVSRAATTVERSTGSDAGTAFHSTHSKANRTVVGKMVERERSGGKNELTKSVVGKIRGLDQVRVDEREVGPDDSISQVSSVRSSRSRK